MFSLTHYLLPHHTNNQRAKLLHPSAVLSLLAVVFVIQLAITQVSVSRPDILGYASQIKPEQILSLTNDYRQSRGLSALHLDSQLNQAASAKAADMFARDYWAHISPLGVQPWSFITSAGYAYRYAGENLARDFSNPQSVVQAWINSPTHRENLVSTKYQDMGLAVIDGTLGGRETTLVVQMFGTRLSSQPAVTGRSTTLVAQVEAAVPTPQVPVLSTLTLSAPVVPASPFTITKFISVSLLALMAGILFLDVIIVYRRRLTRWTSKSLAHLIFLSLLAIAAMSIIRGQII